MLQLTKQPTNHTASPSLSFYSFARMAKTPFGFAHASLVVPFCFSDFTSHSNGQRRIEQHLHYSLNGLALPESIQHLMSDRSPANRCLIHGLTFISAPSRTHAHTYTLTRAPFSGWFGPCVRACVVHLLLVYPRSLPRASRVPGLWDLDRASSSM